MRMGQQGGVDVGASAHVVWRAQGPTLSIMLPGSLRAGKKAELQSVAEEAEGKADGQEEDCKTDPGNSTGRAARTPCARVQALRGCGC